MQSSNKDEENLKRIIGLNLRKIRLEKQIEVKKLCDDLKISVSTYSNIERGITDINISRLIQLSNYLSVHYSEILTFSTSTTYNFSPICNEDSSQTNYNNQSHFFNSSGWEVALNQANQEIKNLNDVNENLLKLIDKFTKS
jgi:transcriptional regulator with XRE-family HTH domain